MFLFFRRNIYGKTNYMTKMVFNNHKTLIVHIVLSVILSNIILLLTRMIKWI